MNEQTQYEYLVDSDAFVALFMPNDAHAPKIATLLAKLEHSQAKLCVSNWVIAETATVLSNKDSQRSAIKLLSMIGDGAIPILTITAEIEKMAHQIFKKQTTKHTSMVDCSNVAVAQFYGIPNILSFDAFYKRHNFTLPR